MDCYQCQYPESHYSFEATEFSIISYHCMWMYTYLKINSF